MFKLAFLLITIALLITVSMLSDKISSKTKTFITISRHKIRTSLY